MDLPFPLGSLRIKLIELINNVPANHSTSGYHHSLRLRRYCSNPSYCRTDVTKRQTRHRRLTLSRDGKTLPVLPEASCVTVVFFGAPVGIFDLAPLSFQVPCLDCRKTTTTRCEK